MSNDDDQNTKNKSDSLIKIETEEVEEMVDSTESSQEIDVVSTEPTKATKTKIGRDDKDAEPVDTADRSTDEDVDVVGDSDEIVVPRITNSGEILRTPQKKQNEVPPQDDGVDKERIFSSFPCHVIPETLSRLTKTKVDGEELDVIKGENGRLRIMVVDFFKKASPYSSMTHKPCTVCNRTLRPGEMHLNFPADLDRRRIWANLLGFKYRDILRSKIGPTTLSIATEPICTEHFAEECFRNHNFNKAAIEAFGVPVAISPDVKTTPSKKSYRVPWVCTICEFNSCSVVELQAHLLDHAETLMKEKGNCDVPPAGFMCPFCRKCTYGYRTVSGFRRHLQSPPIHHCHLRRIYEFAKMNCRASELEPIESWDNWTRRNVYVAYHGCEPPANEIILTPSPTKSIFNPEERNKMLRSEEKRKKAVRSLSFVGREGGTSVNDCNTMQRAVILQIRKNQEFEKMEAAYKSKMNPTKEVVVETEAEPVQGAGKRKQRRAENEKEYQEEKTVVRGLIGKKGYSSVCSSPVKKRVRAGDSTSSCPTTPTKKVKRESPEEAATKEVEKHDPKSAALTRPRRGYGVRLRKRNNGTSDDSSISSGGDGEESKQDEEEEEEKEEKDIVEEEEEAIASEPDDRPLKSTLLKSFVSGKPQSMERYKLPVDAFAQQVPVPAPRVRIEPISARPIIDSSSFRRPNVLARRGILSQRSKLSSKAQESPSKTEKPSEEESTPSKKKEGTPPPKLTLAEILDMKAMEKDPVLEDGQYEEITKEILKGPSVIPAIDESKYRRVTKMKQDMRMSKHCMRQLEAARARHRLFGEQGEEDQYEIMYTQNGPHLTSRTDRDAESNRDDQSSV